MAEKTYQCGFSREPIGPDEKAVLIRGDGFKVRVKEALFFGLFANQLKAPVPGLRMAKSRRRPNVRWVFDPRRFGEEVGWRDGVKLFCELLAPAN
ncbi:MAG: hypothetical protein PHD72_02180 [Patescibacteria group bacterium]|nr:hypothetical protein [Patescibacteria group bacterium]